MSLVDNQGFKLTWESIKFGKFGRDEKEKKKPVTDYYD